MTTALADAVVLMSEQEARQCVARIKAGLEDIRVAALDLEEREGWRALGYKSWRACVKAEFAESVATVYRQLHAAKVDRDVSQVETKPVRLPTVQTQELARLPDAESRQAAYLMAKDATSGDLTQAAVKVAVDQVQAERRQSPRLSGSSELSQDPGDEVFSYSQDAPDIDPSNERDDRPTKPFCSNCADPHRTEDCPNMGAEPEPDGDATPTNEDRDSSDGDESSSEEQETRSSGSNGKGSGGKKGGGSNGTRPFSPRPLNAGDLSRALFDLPIAQVTEAIDENATPAQKEALRKRLGGNSQPAPAARPDLRAVLAGGWTVSELADAITATRTVADRQALQALLLSGRPIEEIRGVFRLADTMIRRHNDEVQRDAILAGTR